MRKSPTNITISVSMASLSKEELEILEDEKINRSKYIREAIKMRVHLDQYLEQSVGKKIELMQTHIESLLIQLFQEQQMLINEKLQNISIEHTYQKQEPTETKELEEKPNKPNEYMDAINETLSVFL
jgi:enolase